MRAAIHPTRSGRSEGAVAPLGRFLRSRAWSGIALICAAAALSGCTSEAEKHKRLFMKGCVQVPAMEGVCSCAFDSMRAQMSDDDIRNLMTEPITRPEYERIMATSMAQCIKKYR